MLYLPLKGNMTTAVFETKLLYGACRKVTARTTQMPGGVPDEMKYFQSAVKKVRNGTRRTQGYTGRIWCS